MQAFLEIPKGYRPTEAEPFMNEKMRAYFKQKLLLWRDELMQRSLDTLTHLKEDSHHEPDDTDQACLDEEFFEELAQREREFRLISKIDDALQRIEDGTYGFCIETGLPISLKRLEARLVATHSLEARQRQEEQRRLFNPSGSDYPL